jgi:uncharacterized protein
VPTVDAASQAFWTGGRDGRLLITRCSACRQLFHPPWPICPHCSCREAEPTAVSGLGHVDGFTVVQRPWIPGYDTPYVVARVRLVEQPDVVLVTNIVDCEPGAVKIGMEVAVIFEPRGDVYVPMFRPRR